MEALEALHSRNSVALLTEPGPSEEQLEAMIKAALRASDHGRLRPWRFLVIEGEMRKQLGKLMQQVCLMNNPDLTPKQLENTAAKALRAPTIVIVVAKVCDHERIPKLEQILSAGGAAQLLLTAAHALGIGAIWRTGSLAYDKAMHQGLGLADSEQIVGFIYMGTAKVVKPLDTLSPADFTEYWQRFISFDGEQAAKCG